MGQKSVRIRHDPQVCVSLFLLAVCFVGSCLAGSLFVSRAGEDVCVTLTVFLRSFLQLQAAGEAISPSTWSVLCEFCFWPVVAFVLGFSSLGVIAIPVVFCIRGFLLSYTIAAFYYVFGIECIPVVLAVFGGTALGSLPVLFAVGRISFISSVQLASGQRKDASTLGRLVCFAPCFPFCAVLIAAGVFLQKTVIPELLAHAAGKLIL